MENLLPFVIYIFTVSVTPGPNTVLSMANAASVGLKRGIRLNLGMLFGLLMVMALSHVASKALYEAIPKAETPLKVITAAYLLYLALRFLTQKERSFDANANGLGFKEGALLQGVNAKVWLLGLSANSAYIVPGDYGEPLSLALSLSIAAMCFLTGLLWAIGGTAARNLYKRHEKAFNVIFALLLFFCAIRLFF